MADMYVPLYKPVIRYIPGEAEPQVFPVGKPFEPTEQELFSFRDKLRPADKYEPGDFVTSTPNPGVPDVPQRGMLHPPVLNEDGTLPGDVANESEEREVTRRRGRPPRVSQEEDDGGTESKPGGSPLLTRPE